jgi:DNA-binding transcriptional MerR regulator
METMTLSQLARQTDLAPPTVRRYLEQFPGQVPAIHADHAIRFPAEAVAVVERIHDLARQGRSPAEIAAVLGSGGEARDPDRAVTTADIREMRRVLVMLARRISETAATRHQEIAELRLEVADLRAQMAELRGTRHLDWSGRERTDHPAVV